MKKYFSSLIISLSIVVASLVPLPTAAIDVFQNCGGAAGGTGSSTGGSVTGTASGSQICGAKGDSFTNIMKNIINTILFVLGIVAVIMIIIGGIRYVTSNGDSNQIKSAKDTILYSVIGLVVAIMAYAIVGFVLDRLK